MPREPDMMSIARLRPAAFNRVRLLPAQPTRLVGREKEVDLARMALVRDDVRLLTFRGPAGVGKTRLAMAVAESVGEQFDGVYVANLAGVSDYRRVGAAIAEAVGVGAESAGEGLLLASLASRLAETKTLLIVDNFEHVMPAAEFLVELLAWCPSITLLVTSREALRLRWEHIFLVRPLSVPEVSGEMGLEVEGESAAVTLFVERARAADPSFELTKDNVAAVGELCVRLDGLPLAIELAAARAAFVSPRAMVAGLGQRLDLLVGGANDLPERQRTARAAIGYSYELLTADEKALFRQVSVFSGGCTSTGAVAVAQGVVESKEAGGGPRLGSFGPILEGLTGLAHKSLLYHEMQAGGEVRFRMLETVRAYADEQLRISGEQVQARARALAYYTALAERAGVGLRGGHQGTWLRLLDDERDNMRAALGWCIEGGEAQGGLELAGRLGGYWEVRGHQLDGHGWMDELLAQPGAMLPTEARALALSAAGLLAASQGDDARAEEVEAESLRIWRELGDRQGSAGSLTALAGVAQRRGDTLRARTMLDESLVVRREAGDEWGTARVLHQLGDVAFEQGQYPLARAAYEESIVLWQAHGDGWGVARCLESLGVLAQTRGDAERALRLIGAGSGLRQSSEGLLVSGPIERRHLQQAMVAAEAVLGPAGAASTLAAGRAMTLDEAVLYARTVHERTAAVQTAPLTQPAAESPFAWLTRREQEVATLLLRGLSNRQIAEELVITERTAETHVCRILSKLGLGSRAQISAWVMDRSLGKQPKRAC